MNTSAILEQVTQALVADLHAHPFGQRLCAGDVTRNEYVAFLVQTYLYVVHTRPLLYRAGHRLASQGKPKLARLLLQKAVEENGHEEWVVNDLRVLGEHEEIVHREKPVPAVAAYIAWNSYTVEHSSPVAFLGAAYVLEAISASYAGIVVKNLLENDRIRGIQGAVSFLKGHADADAEHIITLGKAIDAFAMSDSDHEEILLTAAITRSTYTGLCTAIASKSADHAKPCVETHAS